jgi:hypothetical protein
MRSSSLELTLLARSTSSRSLQSGSGAVPARSLPARSQSVRCIASAADGSATGPFYAGGDPACRLTSAHSVPACLPQAALGLASGGGSTLLSASSSQMELLQSPEDGLLGLSIVRVRLSSGASFDSSGCNVVAPAAAAAGGPCGVSGGGSGGGVALMRNTSAPGIGWRPSAALAAAAAAAAMSSGIHYRTGTGESKAVADEEALSGADEVFVMVGNSRTGSMEPSVLPFVAEETPEASPPPVQHSPRSPNPDSLGERGRGRGGRSHAGRPEDNPVLMALSGHRA